MAWHQESDMDIVSIINPMAGPWQAIGQLSDKNKIIIYSDLEMVVDAFPKRFYRDERIKFTARLTEKGEAVHLHEFLNRIELKVVFTEITEDQEHYKPHERAKGIPIGTFVDDGVGLDEKAHDGVLTVEVDITVPAGKYLARVTSGNGVFFRSLDQDVFVFPSPIETKIVPGENGEERVLEITPDPSAIKPQSVAVHAELFDPADNKIVYQAVEQPEQKSVKIQMLDLDEAGRYRWQAWVYANDLDTDRPLIFHTQDQSFAIADFAALEKAGLERELREAERLQEEQAAKLEAQKAKDREMALILILGGNLFLITLAMAILLIMKRRRRARQRAQSIELQAPPVS